MPKFRNFLILIFGFVLLTTAGSVSAAKSSYYDFGPYYGNQQVLGFSFSVLENLPAPQIPDNLMPKPAGGILPDSPFTFLDRVAENVQLTFTFDPAQKEQLRWEHALERLEEAKTLIDQAKVEAALRAASDYHQTVTTLAENLDKLPAETITKIEEQAAAHAVLSQGLSFGSSPAAAEVWNLSLDASHGLLDKVADVEGQGPLPESLSTGIQALKQQGLISEEESNKIYGYKSRAEVREELEKLVSSSQFPLSEIAKLDEGIDKYYSDVYQQTKANLQVAELKSYQGLPQPSEDLVEELEKWQENQNITPSNNIKPYLWYNRAQDLVKEVDLSNFSTEQQAEVTQFYPGAAGNPTYNPSPVSETASPSAQPTVSYIGDAGGALPGEPTYFFKQFGETLSLAFTVSEAEKARLNIEFAERRLAEAQSLSGDPKKVSQYADALQRYHDAVLDATEYIGGIRDERVAKEAAKRLENQAARHEIALEKGILPPPAQKPELIANAIKATEDAMDQAADNLDRPALPPALASRLDDLKTQGLVLPEEAEDLVNSQSRGEVREKIRKLTELGSFPPADAKKLDEAQARVSSTDYNQLVEVRKVEELQNLRAVQTQLAQTPTLKATNDSLGAREQSLFQTIDTSLIRSEDLAGREDLRTLYQTLQATSSARPINRGQFGNQPPPPTRVALSVCPAGAIFKPSEGCVWEDSGKKINDFNQYRCDKAGHYYSFPAQKCVPNQPGKGFGDDSKPVCPVGYAWVWGSQSCQKSTGDEVNPKYSCPDLQYYSPNEEKCVPIPNPGDPFPSACSEQGTYWSFSEQKCIAWPEEKEGKYKNLTIPQPIFVTPDNPFYPVKGWGEFFQKTFAFTPERRQAVSLTQAKERLAEAAYALKKDNKEGVKQAIAAYTAAMQGIVADVSKEGLTQQAKTEIGKILSEESLEQNLLLSKLSAWADEEEDTILNTATSVTILGIDKAADLSGEPAISDEVKAKIEELPAEMISEEDKKKLLDTDSRVAVRVELNRLVSIGGLNQKDTNFLDEDFADVDAGTSVEIEELKKLAEIADISSQKDKIQEQVTKNEDIVQKLDEFQKTFELGEDIPADIRPYVRLTRIDEVSQTVRPDVVRIDDFQNRKDIVLAVATLQQEYRPTRESLRQVEDFRRRNPNAALPYDLARIEALSYSLGVREQAGACFLPTPPFPANTPCPAPGAAIPISSYYNTYSGPGSRFIELYQPQPQQTASVDKNGNPLVYGQGPTPQSAGVCPDGYHWMYDSGGWCMSNGGSYGSSYNYTPSGSGLGYTPYSPYYTAPGAPSGTYPGSPYSYSPPNYYGVAPTYYTTNPPSGTVPGSGPRPTAPGQCPTGFHWMSDSGGWCMANGGTYVPSNYGGLAPGTSTSDTPPPGGYNCGSQAYDPATGKCRDGACPGGYNWDGSKCVVPSPNLNQSSCGPGYYWSNGSCFPNNSGGGGYSTGSSYQYGCTPGYYWDGSRCVAGNYEGGGWSDTGARSQNWCQPPASGCGANSYWDYGSCYCRSSSTYYGGGGSTPSNQCQGLSCGGGSWLDYSTCSCKYSGGSGTSSTGSTITCYPPSSGCPGGWYDYGTCSCKTSSGSGGSSSGSCPSGSHWMSDNGGYCMSDSTGGGSSSGGGSTTSSGSCPSGYHWMSDNGGWCMSDGGSGGSTSTSPSPSPSPAPAPSPSSEPAPAPAPAPTP